jgi:hypothetical protein
VQALCDALGVSSEEFRDRAGVALPAAAPPQHKPAGDRHIRGAGNLPTHSFRNRKLSNRRRYQWLRIGGNVRISLDRLCRRRPSANFWRPGRGVGVGVAGSALARFSVGMTPSMRGRKGKSPGVRRCARQGFSALDVTDRDISTSTYRTATPVATVFCNLGLWVQCRHRHSHPAVELDLEGAGGVRVASNLTLFGVVLQTAGGRMKAAGARRKRTSK